MSIDMRGEDDGPEQFEQTRPLPVIDHAARMDALRRRQTDEEADRKRARVEALLTKATVTLTELAIVAPQEYAVLIAGLAIESWKKLPQEEKPTFEAAVMARAEAHEQEVTP